MKLVELKCKNCGAVLKVNPDSKEITCSYCQTTFKLDDEVQHIKIDDMEQNGYEFEKGRLRAQQESNLNNNSYTQPQKKKNKTLWLVLAWLFLFPFTATYFIAKSKKLDKKKKIIIIVIMWILFFIIAAVDNSSETTEKKDRIIECYSKETYDKLDELIGEENIEGSFSSSSTCDRINLKTNKSQKINIEMSGDELTSIKLDDKYIYSTDESVEIYDPVTLRVKEKK